MSVHTITRAPTVAARRPAPHLGELAPFQVATLPASPFPETWGFNPSILRRRDGTWLCSVRCANYCMPGGVAVVAPGGVVKNRNVIVELSPARRGDELAWNITRSFEVEELDDRPRRYNRVLGYEDLRLVELASGKLYAVSTAMQLSGNGTQEIVILELDDKLRVARSLPLRGTWSDQHQKNWTPYQGADELRLVYSIERGGVHDLAGILYDGHPPPRPSDASTAPDLPDHLHEAWLGPIPTGRAKQIAQTKVGALEVRTMGSAPRMGRPGAGTYRPEHFPLRGGSQLIPLSTAVASSLPADLLPADLPPADLPPADRLPGGVFLGVAHGTRIVGRFKFYWHVFYLMDGRGTLLGRTPPFKLADTGIEFCAGLALAPGGELLAGGAALALSFGTDDHDAHIGVVPLAAVLDMLTPVTWPNPPPSSPSRRTVTE